MKSKKLNREEMSDLRIEMLFLMETLIGEIRFLENKMRSDIRRHGEDTGEYKIHPESLFNMCKLTEKLSETVNRIFSKEDNK
jgi:hypothetical protein